LEFRHSESLRRLSWTVALGVVTVHGVNTAALESGLASAQQAVSFDDPQKLGPVMRRIEAFDSFFEQNGFHSPLSGQLKDVRQKGLPGGNPMIRALLLCEMSTGLLMGAQDASAIRGTLVCDLAQEGESFAGMRAEVQCRKDEIVLRDAEGTIATLLQGPDRRTRLGKATKDVAFFVFSVPGVGRVDVEEGVEAIRRLFAGACDAMSVQVHESQAAGKD
jgi:DNA/RNA-binding domain of Phe-tRNA-synthetase-like protein